ncbi:MAG TPA: acyltransferase family protein [Ramlibacter sp.]
MRESHAPAYRADVDGLRAVAVLAVIGYHYFPQWVPAGFAGVDVFFVISGYLITGIITGAVEAGRFSIADFYSRRIRRIFPALVIVLLACAAIGWAVLYYEEYLLLGKHIAAGAGFVMNIVLWSETGYFDPAAETKPLLHLWSLGVEEQFYIVWPLVIAYVCRTRVSRFLTVIAVFAASLVACGVYTPAHAAAAFYLPQFRFWELMAGAALALHPQWAARSARGADIRSLAGLVLLVASGFVIRAGAPFPGWRALVPVAATFLLLSAGSQGWVNRAFLARKAMVAIGLISYPLYLWHWPLLSFLRIANNDAPVTPGRGAVLFAVSLVLAWLTYELVERPVRRGARGGTKAIAAAAVMACAAGLGLALLFAQGVPSREVNSRDPTWPARVGPYTTDVLPWLVACPLPPAQAKIFAHCTRDKRGPERFALLGDSKADSVFRGLVRTSTDDGRWMFIGGADAQGVVEPVVSDWDRYSTYKAQSEAALDAVARNPNVQTVVVVAATRSLFHLGTVSDIDGLPSSPYYPQAYDGVSRFVKRLVDAGKKVVLVIDHPTLPDPKLCLADARVTWHGKIGNFLAIGHADPRCEISLDRQRQLAAQYLKLLDAVRKIAPDRITLFDQAPYLCDMARRVCGSQDGKGTILYSFADHVSDEASNRIGRGLNQFLTQRDAQNRARDSSSNRSL